MGSFLSVVAGFAPFAILHSLLLTQLARDIFQAIFGQKVFRRWYRLCYSAVSVVTFGVYVVWAHTLPDSRWFELSGAAYVAAWGVRILGMWLMYKAMSQFGVFSFLGFDGLKKSTGPADGLDISPIVAVGPYKYIRHPIYAGAMLFLWGDPVWTANKAAFNLAATLYLYLGSKLEEARLTKLHGDAYRSYARETPPFIPRLKE